MNVARAFTVPAAPLMALLAIGCGDDGGPAWQAVQRDLPGALLSVWGTSSTDVWAVGGDPGDGSGPMVIHYDGAAWTRLDTERAGDLWWVFGFEGGPIYMGGAGGTILRYQNGAFTPMSTPGNDTIFGIWGASPTELWAVGGATGGSRGAFAWRLQGEEWVEAAGFPAALADTDAMWKVHGRAADDVWIVGTNGKAVHWNGTAFAAETAGGESLFTVHSTSERFVAVGGFGTGSILENDGSGWTDVSPSGAFPMVGVSLDGGDPDGGGYAVGQFGAVYQRGTDGWSLEDVGLVIDESLHAVWLDPGGGVWAVGGQVLTTPLVRGVMLHKGDLIEEGGL
jgi:hypothetical protein